MRDKARIDTWVGRGRPLDLADVDWDAVPRTPLPAPAIRVLRYMQDIESHTIIYLRSLLSTPAIDDPDVATFLACWFAEETFHGRALARFLEAAGHAPLVRARSEAPFAARLEEAAIRRVARAWPDFVAVHMTWGAINELTTLTGYQRLAELADHPVLTDLLARIGREESRHFAFYFHQAELRLANPTARRVTRFLVDRWWAPVGSGVQPDHEVRFLANYLMGGPAGRVAARKVDATIRRLPGFADAPLLEAWIDRAAARHPMGPPMTTPRVACAG